MFSEHSLNGIQVDSIQVDSIQVDCYAVDSALRKSSSLETFNLVYAKVYNMPIVALDSKPVP